MDVFLEYCRDALAVDSNTELSHHIDALRSSDFERLFQDPFCKILCGKAADPVLESVELQDFALWTDFISHRLRLLLRDDATVDGKPGPKTSFFILLGIAGVLAFSQSNITGPPLSFRPRELLFPDGSKTSIQGQLTQSLSADGISPYRLIPNSELFCLSKAIFYCPEMELAAPLASWMRLRTAFLHQRLLSEISPLIEADIFRVAAVVQLLVIDPQTCPADLRACFLLEKAMVYLHHGRDAEARQFLVEASQARGFEYALTGRLGKKTKYQSKDTSQLVVLARSSGQSDHGSSADAKDRPTNLDLNDDTLLESISFTKADVQDENSLPPSLRTIDPEHQPQLQPLDSIILLTTAAAITNTSPADGITREETLPYATRVLEGVETNWQIYTQALLVRSRIEGYRSRTVERSLLQLQALVDQVIVELKESASSDHETQPTTFLPRPSPKDSATEDQRLQYIFQLDAPTRWELEAELAARWVNLGGLASALEIYERLEMWAEVALCLASTDKEDKARRVVRKQLFHSADVDGANEDSEQWMGRTRDPPPADAPRLYCILGDLDHSLPMYEMAWEISGGKYARAQLAIGRYWYGTKDYAKASVAYSKALKIKQLDHGTWFTLGCCFLELAQYSRAAEVFSRAVQIDDSDAESWSNLAVALLHSTPEGPTPDPVRDGRSTGSEDKDSTPDGQSGTSDRQKHRRQALTALKQAAKLKRDDYRIWENILTVAASLVPAAFADIVITQQRIIDLRGTADGENCVDAHILGALVRHITGSSPPIEGSDAAPEAANPGLVRMACQLVDGSVVPLITTSSGLWYTVALLELWRKNLRSALDAEEKAWRSLSSPTAWETGTEKQWQAVVDATLRLVENYQRLGPQPDADGPVSKDWKFKARSALRGIVGRGKPSWEGTQGWTALGDALDGLRS
jgi:tetratricopeptide (TPR) repeat protein